MRRIDKTRARARLLLFTVASWLVPGGVPFGLVDQAPDRRPRRTGG